MINEVSYWVASHLTGIFEIKDDSKDLLKRGSRGAGFSINRGVRTTVSRTNKNGVEIYFDGKKKTSKEAIVTTETLNILLDKKERSKLRINHDFEVPISSGYGASAAGAVGTVFALNDLLEFGLSKLESFQLAHKAEVLTKSGLGDVIGLYQGGFEIRLKEGAPGVGKTIPFTNVDGWNVATVHLGTLSTSEILSNPQKRKKVNDAGNNLINKLITFPNFSTFIELSVKFSKEVNLWSPELQGFIKNLPQTVIGSQIMLGNSSFVFYHDKNDLSNICIPGVSLNKETICHDTIVKCE